VIGQNGPHGSQLIRFDGDYDAQADIAWLRFDGCDPQSRSPRRLGYRFRELDIAHRGLTDRERVAAPGLVASRKTNCEVAAEVYLPTWAVEYYLANIFPKVGVRSRHELSVGLSAPQP
jgi:DNA-binding CsgD family transcriptional regulator